MVVAVGKIPPPKRRPASGRVQFSEAAAIASLARASFYDFVREFWGSIISEEPVWNWHIEFLCNELQVMAERVFRGETKLYDLIVNIPPGTTKSTIISVMFPAWVWTRMPAARFICASYTDKLALDLSRKSRDICRSEKYRACFPEVVIRDDQDTKSYYMNRHGGSRYAVGTGAGVTGFHAHFILIDDPIDPLAAVSEEELKTANRWMTETIPSRKVDKKVTVTILVMQRLHQNDPTGHLLNKDRSNIRHICLPAELSDKINPPELAARYVDGMLDPVRLSREVLEEAWRDLLDYGYSCQFRQDPIPRGGGMFKADRILIRAVPPMLTKVVRYWDKAATGGGGAFTVGFKMGMVLDKITSEQRFWVMDIYRAQVDSWSREVEIKKIAKADGRTVRIGLEQEPGSGGKESAQATVSRLAGYSVVIDKVTGAKELRADPFSTQVNAGNVFMAPGAWNAAFMQEISYYPHSTYKDQVDAGSGAFSMLVRPRRRVGAF